MANRHRVLLFTLLALLFCGLAQHGADQALGAPLAQAPTPAPPPFFLDTVTAAELAVAEPAVIRQRMVKLDLAQLPANAESVSAAQSDGSGKRLTLNFFTDASFTATLQPGATMAAAVGSAMWMMQR